MISYVDIFYWSHKTWIMFKQRRVKEESTSPQPEQVQNKRAAPAPFTAILGNGIPFHVLKEEKSGGAES